MPPFQPRRRYLLASLALTLCAGPVSASAARDELLRFVPSDVGFCLVVQGLRDKLADVQASPFGKELAKLAPAVAADEWKQLTEAEAYLKKHLGVGWADLRDDLLGDAFAFAYRPGPADKPEQEQGMVLVRARDARKLGA